MNEERFREMLRELRKRLVGSQGKLSALTKTGDDVKPIAVMTISDIETGQIQDPSIFTIARLVEAMPGMTLSKFFMRVEEDVTDLSQTVAANDPFAEERISQATLRWLWRNGFIRAPEAVAGPAPVAGPSHQGQRATDHQHRAAVSPEKAELHPAARKSREHHGARPKARRAGKR